MDFARTGYWMVVLGGSSGLGFASALKLASHGMNLCIVHQNTRIEMQAVDEGFTKIRETGVKLLTFNTDAVNPEKRHAVLKELKNTMEAGARVRCLLHSIAKGNLKAMIPGSDYQLTKPRLEAEDFILTLENMALCLYSWTLELHDLGLFSSDARVLSFTSEGSKRAWRYYAAVSAAKSTLESLTRSIALEFASSGIRANCIQAGVTETRSLTKIKGYEKLMKSSLERNPFQRLTRPEDVAAVVYLLCKDEAGWINGAIIPVDGGEQIS